MSKQLLVFVAVMIVALHVSNLTFLKFNALDISGNNFMPWTLDIKAHMRSMNLSETLNEPNNSSDVDRAKSLIFIRRHLCDSLKDEYLTVEDPKELRKNLMTDMAARRKYNFCSAQSTEHFEVPRLYQSQ
ncbi:hypothetical protein OROMI_029035 [Orobanche minor]